MLAKEIDGVNRGVCQTQEGLLTSVVECKDITYNDRHEIVYKDENSIEHSLAESVPVSMNMWGGYPRLF